MKNTKILLVLTVALATLLSTGSAFAALHLEGQSGIFLNSLAYPVAPSKIEASIHYVDLDPLGSISTQSVSFGLKNNVELGYTHISTDVPGVNDQNLFVGKWQFSPETKQLPAFSILAAQRSIDSKGSSLDYGLTATKVVIVGKKPLVLDLGIRNTKAVGIGLFGWSKDRKWKSEGSFAYFILPNLAVGSEYKQQIDGQTWRDIAVRYVANSNWNIDFGIADLGPAIDNQVALAVTHAW
jgi:hypothetical protein